MTKLFKVKKDGSKYAWASSNNPEENNGFTVNHEDAAMFKQLGFIKVSPDGNTAWLVVEPKLQAAINPTTNASVGNRIVGFQGMLVDQLTVISAQTAAKRQEAAIAAMTPEQISQSVAW